MQIHLIEGADGCDFAVKHGCTAIVVDALRASATAAALLDAGATELLVVPEIEDAFDAKRRYPDARLFGERGGLPPEGFDGGNSPQMVAEASGHRVIFTTTTGAQRLIGAWGAGAVYMGTTTNVTAVLDAAKKHERDVVIIPAGLATDPTFNAQEDWTAAAAIAIRSGLPIATGVDRFDYWRGRIETEGIAGLFNSAPHADKLREIGLDGDIAFCAQVDITKSVPMALRRDGDGIVVGKGT